jgi:ferredoxin
MALNVIDRAGRHDRLAALEGWRLLDILCNQDGKAGLCGGAVTCASCHVVIDPTFAELSPSPREGERAMLGEWPAVADHSRLACQIIWQPAIDGLVVTLPREF